MLGMVNIQKNHLNFGTCHPDTTDNVVHISVIQPNHLPHFCPHYNLIDHALQWHMKANV